MRYENEALKFSVISEILDIDVNQLRSWCGSYRFDKFYKGQYIKFSKSFLKTLADFIWNFKQNRNKMKYINRIKKVLSEV